MDRHLFNAVDAEWRHYSCSLINGRRNVGDMVELGAQSATFGNLLRPRNCHCVASATKVRRNLFHPLEWRVERPSPTDIEMVFAFCRAEIIHVLKEPLWVFGDTILKRRCAPCAVNGSFCRSPVITSDVNDQCVFRDAQSLKLIDDSRYLCVGVLQEPSKGFHQSACDRAVTLGVVVPRWNLFGAPS